MRRIMVVVLGWLVMTVAAGAADHRGIIRGRLVGGDGKAIGGAVVRAEREETGDSRRTTTDGDGGFVLPELDPGSYRIRIDDQRFTGIIARADVRAGDTAHLTLQAGLGGGGMIDFRPYFQYIDRTSPAFRTRFEDPFITALPLDRRNSSDLVALAPGLTTSPTGPLAAGTLPTSTAYIVDGVAAFDPLFGTAILDPLPESISELVVFVPPLNAALGRSAGAQASIVTKSGTNRFGGAALAFYQQEAERLQVGGLAGGPIARNRSFFFGDMSHDSENGTEDDISGFTRASGRLDVVGGTGRFTARYAAGRGGSLDRRADLLGVTHVHQLSTNLVNDARVGVSRLAFADRWSGVLPELDAIEGANVLTWSAGAHLVSGGIEYFGVAPVEALLLPEESTISAFVQDQWRASSRLSLTGGVRVDRLSRDEDPSDAEDSLVSPRGGFVWALGKKARHAVRGDFGRHLQATGSALDAWSVGLQRQWGRIRTLEVGYVGTRTDDEFGGFGTDAQYDGLRIQLQQRSETGLSTHIGYTYGRWTIASASEQDRVRASLDARHKLSAAFTWQLPFGRDARWFTDGWTQAVFGRLQVSGIAVTQSGRPRIDRSAPEGSPWRNVDLALAKTLGVGAGTLELRAEMFNVSNRANPRPGVLGTGYDALFADEAMERRLQFGGRFRF